MTLEEANLFKSDTYDTDPNHKHVLADRLLLNSRFYFYFHNFKIFTDSGRLGREGRLDGVNQILQSNRNVKLVEDCGGRIHIAGLDNLRALNGRPVVMMGNHMSLLETALLHAIVRPHLDFTFVIKQELMKIYGFRDIMTALESVCVGRANPRDDLKAVLNEGAERLSRGKSMIIFPQSTRSVDFDPEKFNSIGVKLAKKAGVEVLPFALKTDFTAPGKLIRDLGPVDRKKLVCFEFGKPMKIEGGGKEELQKTIDFIQDRLADFKRREAEISGTAKKQPRCSNTAEQ